MPAASEDVWDLDDPGQPDPGPRAVAVVNTAPFSDRVIVVTSSRIHRASPRAALAEELAQAAEDETDPDAFLEPVARSIDLGSIREVSVVVSRPVLTISVWKTPPKGETNDVTITCDDAERRDLVFDAVEIQMGDAVRREETRQPRDGMIVGAILGMVATGVVGAFLYSIASRLANGGTLQPRSAKFRLLVMVVEWLGRGGVLIVTGATLAVLLAWLVVRLRHPLEYRKLVRVTPSKG
ncbi:MAG: hypothetical protein KF787_02875 [Phycisphaeraceae bacterium]|nr:hypothetical protein [Phycisphaerae bacterium]MBX3391570.1 hypothetical protein [Phycisphaeraceae bacterium]